MKDIPLILGFGTFVLIMVIIFTSLDKIAAQPTGIQKCLGTIGSIDECARIYKTDREFVERQKIEMTPVPCSN